MGAGVTSLVRVLPSFCTWPTFTNEQALKRINSYSPWKWRWGCTTWQVARSLFSLCIESNKHLDLNTQKVAWARNNNPKLPKNWQASCATSSLPVGFGGVSCNGSSSAKTVTITQLPGNHHLTSSCSHMFEIADRNGFKTKTLPSIFYFNVLIFLLFPFLLSLGPIVTANFENNKNL